MNGEGGLRPPFYFSGSGGSCSSIMTLLIWLASLSSAEYAALSGPYLTLNMLAVRCTEANDVSSHRA